MGNEQKGAAKNILEALQKSAGYLQDKLSPLQSSLLKYLRALEPAFNENMADFGREYIIKAAKEFKCFTSADVDALSLQWEKFIALKFTKMESQRIDAFYGKHLKQICSEGEDFSTLDRFIETVLCMPSSNASVERGFSATKRYVNTRENMSLATLTGLRVGKETVSLYGGTNNVPIPHALQDSHINAWRNYQERVENEKKEKAREKERIQAELQAASKRKAEEKDRSDYLSKKKRYEDEEAEVRGTLKFDL